MLGDSPLLNPARHNFIITKTLFHVATVNCRAQACIAWAGASPAGRPLRAGPRQSRTLPGWLTKTVELVFYVLLVDDHYLRSFPFRKSLASENSCQDDAPHTQPQFHKLSHN